MTLGLEMARDTPDQNCSEKASPRPLQLWLFGRARVQISGQEVEDLPPGKELALLAQLVLRSDHQALREVLAEALWPEKEQPVQLVRLRKTLSRLRQMLRDEAKLRIQSLGNKLLRLDVTAAEVDVLVFDELIQRAKNADAAERSALLNEAVTLYDKGLLPGCTETWVAPEIGARETAYVDALLQLAQGAMEQEEYSVAERHLERILQVDPECDSAVRSLLMALDRQGRTAAAHDRAVELRSLRLRQLGDFEPDTRSLMKALQAKMQQPPNRPSLDPPLSSTPLCRLPGWKTRFVGREEALESTAKNLERQPNGLQRTRLITLHGPGGIGKSRLAEQLALRLADQYYHGVDFVEIWPLQPPSSVAQAVVAGLRLSAESNRSLEETLVRYLRGKRLLLVLDGCEYFEKESADLVDKLLHDCPYIDILITSQGLLGLKGETRVVVEGLSCPVPHAVGTPHERTHDLLAYDAIHLFRDRAQAARADFVLTPQNARTIVEICYGLEGIPLSIELAAARVSALTVAQILEGLTDRLRLLRGGSGEPERHRSIKACIEWSYNLLTSSPWPLQQLLWYLSVFQGRWTAADAEGVCRASGLSAEDAGTTAPLRRAIAGSESLGSLARSQIVDLLEALVRYSLLHFEERDGLGWYWMLETIRDYTLGQLKATGDEQEVRRNHALYYLEQAEQFEPKVLTREQDRVLDYLEVEHGNLRAALSWFQENGEAKDGLRLCCAINGFWHIRGYWGEAITWTTGFLRLSGLDTLPPVGTLTGSVPSIADPSGDSLQGSDLDIELAKVQNRALVVAGVMAQMQGELRQARYWYERALVYSRRLGTDSRTANILNNLGLVHLKRGDLIEARSCFEESLTIREVLGDETGMAEVWNNLWSVAFRLGDYEDARANIEKSLAIRQKLGIPNLVASGLSKLGSIAVRKGDYPAAHSWFSQSLEKFRSVNDKQGIGQELELLGVVALEQKALEEAQSLLEEALAIQQEKGAKGSIASCLNNLALVRYFQNDYDGARTLVEQSLALSREQEYQSTVAGCLSILADITLMQGNPDVAQWLQRESLIMRSRVTEQQQAPSDPWGMAFCLMGLAGVAMVKQQPARAAQLLGAAEALFEGINSQLPPVWRDEHDSRVKAIRSSLSDRAYRAAWNRGKEMALHQMVSFALDAHARG